jgi:hypothetical protein
MPHELAIGLGDLADRINHEHEGCETALRAGLAHAIEAGLLLIEAKGRIEHGGWLPWVGANGRFSERTAQSYMQVSRRAAELGWSDPQRAADLSYREALAMLAKPSEDLELHEVCQLFPPMRPEEFAGLKADIAAHGQCKPIWTLYGKVIDGKERLRACRELGIKPKTQEWDGDDGDLLAFVCGVNIHRTHLTRDQRAMCAVKFMEYKGRRTDAG